MNKEKALRKQNESRTDDFSKHVGVPHGHPLPTLKPTTVSKIIRQLNGYSTLECLTVANQKCS